MGVTGLWRLIEPAGKPVPVETLENKVLAVDISIWLHQMVKGYQDAKGAPLPNAHLMGLFQRLCKLLYFRIKPVFVFDGGFPDLKRETIAKRQDSKLKYNSESERLKRELALILGKKTAVSSLLGKQISPKKSNPAVDNADDIFKLPALPDKETESESESEDETSSGSIIDLHSVDIESQNFKSLPAKQKYDLLIELKETRKMNSWGRLHELPKKSDNFSDFQMQRLLKRRKVQECLQETEKEIGDGGMSLNELESLLNEEGIDTKIESLPTRRIASNETTRFLLINNVKQALADARKKKEAESNQNISKMEQGKEGNVKNGEDSKDELEEDLEKAIKMSLECVNEESDVNASISKTDSSWTSFVTDSDSEYSDSEEEDGYKPPAMTSAKAYIMQYSDYTSKVINKLVNSKKYTDKDKSKVPNVDQIIDELNNEKTIISDNIELSSSDDESKNIKRGTAEISNNQDQSVVEISDEINSPSQDIEISCRDYEYRCIKHGPAEANDNQDKSEVSDNVNSLSNDMEITQSSVIWLENPATETINLDTSTEDHNIVTKDTKEAAVDSKLDSQKSESNTSDSDDEDLEEVPEVFNKDEKDVIQLTLKIGDAPEDDIFADIFGDNKSSEASKMNLKDVTKSKEFRYPEPIPSTSFDNIESLNIPCSEINDNKHIVKNHSIKVSSGKINPGNMSNLGNVSDNPIYDVPSTGKSSLSDNGNNIGAKDGKLQKELTSVEPFSAPSKIPEISDLKNKETVPKVTKEPVSTETLNAMAEELQNEEQNLLQEKGRLDRIGRNITEQMTKEAQELLQIFGIPYIVAPMEAEAQCAFLESVNLTDGTITDDSDIWLFGGRTVYKNFFNQKKHVLQFLSERIERSFNLSREQLILLALLVGSDYTTGVSGVGPVTALEILASFPFNKKQFLKEPSKQDRYNQILAGLQEFKKWVRAGKRTDNVTLKKKLKNVDLTEDFPSMRVVQAYLEPNVEKSEDKFTWGELDITVLRDYTKTKFGWSQNKLDEIIKPVIKRLTERKSQRSVQDYFKRKIAFQSLEDQMSKRVKAAVQRMDPNAPIDQQIISTEQPNSSKPERKRKTNKYTRVGKDIAGSSHIKKKKNKLSEETVLSDLSVKVVSQTNDGKSNIEIQIPKSNRVQEFIPQREKEKLKLLQNKLKAIEIFRKTKLDIKKKTTKRRAVLPKEKAELSESSDSN